MNNLLRAEPPLYPFDAEITTPVKFGLLRNKVPVYMIDTGTEDIMRVDFTFRAGAEKEYLPLLANTVNMMLTEGSLYHTARDINRIIDYYGAFINLYAEKDNAGLIIYFLNRHIEKVLALAKEILFDPVFPEKELNILMKKRLRWYKVAREKVQNLAMDQFFESIFGSNHPYGRQIRETDFDISEPAVLKDFHSKYYRPDNMTVIMSGKIDERAFSLTDDLFGEINPDEIYFEETANYLKGEERKKIRIEKPGAIQSAIRIGSPAINKRHPDYPGLKILNVILGGYFGSRLMKNIREEKGYTYGIHSILSSLNLSGFKVISTETGNGNTGRAIDEIYHEIRKLQTVPVENDELQLVRNYMLGEMIRMFDGPFALAESFKAAWEFGLDFTYYQRLTKKIRSITADEILDLAANYYKIEDLYEIVSG